MQGAQAFTNYIRGRKVTSLGVLFDFTDNDHNTTVQKVEDMIKETWVCFIQSMWTIMLIYVT